MAIDFNDDQIGKLRNLGIEIGMGGVMSSGNDFRIKKNNNFKIVAGSVVFGMVGFGMVMLLKKDGSTKTSNIEIKTPDDEAVARISPIQTNIQKHLLASQQYYSQALQAQTNGTSQEVIEFLNKSLEEAGKAIANFGDDFRGYQQRGKIYQSLISTTETLSEQDKQFLNQAINDLSRAYKLNTELAEISRDLANLYAKAGDATKTIFYLSETIRIEPTKAQNFYDLARIQSQSGDVVSALETYKQLVWLVSDTSQKQIIEAEKESLEKILADNPDLKQKTNTKYIPTPTEGILREGPKIEASKKSNVIIAAAEEKEELEVSGMTESNSYSGEAKLGANQADVEIKNENLTSQSQVYVTIVKGGKNQVLRVKSKTESSFRVGLDVPIAEDIEFKWWIID